MIRIILYFLGLAGVATGLAWLADRPGNLVIDWQGYVIETSVFRAIVLLLFLLGLTIVAWTLMRQLLASPSSISRVFRRRRERSGLEALSSGMIAIGAGDRALAARYAVQARKAMPNEPLTDLLRAQAAQLIGDRATARRIFEGMLGAPDTELLGLRGLFLEAQRENEIIAARQFAERAVRLNPKLSWAVDALFELQCKQADWAGALETLAAARKNGHVEKDLSDRRRAVLMTAQAMVAQDRDMDRALALASEAHGLAPDLVPAAEIAGRLYASRGNTAKAAAILAKTWKRTPHPDLANAYAHARPGDSASDRLRRVKELAAITPNNREAPIALATAAIEAHEWALARQALEPLFEKRLSQRVCVLMARIEGGQHGDTGRVREWLARAVHAPRDPAWVADGHISDHWLPISPVSGALDAYTWKVPVEEENAAEAGALLLEELRLLQSSDSLKDQAAPIDAAVERAAANEAVAARATATAIVATAVAEDVPDDDNEPDDDSAGPGSGRAGSVGKAGAGPNAAVIGKATEGRSDSRSGEGMRDNSRQSSLPAVVRSESAAGERDGFVGDERSAASVGSATDASAARPVADGAVKQGAQTGAHAGNSDAKPAVTVASKPDESEAAAQDQSAKAVSLKSLPAPETDRPAARSASKPPIVGRKPVEEPTIFVSPRAPDDPGTDAGDSDEVLTPVARFRKPSVA